MVLCKLGMYYYHTIRVRGFSHDAMGSLPNGETDLALADNAQPSFSPLLDGTETIDSLLLLLVAMVGNVVVCS